MMTNIKLVGAQITCSVICNRCGRSVEGLESTGTFVKGVGVNFQWQACPCGKRSQAVGVSNFCVSMPPGYAVSVEVRP